MISIVLSLLLNLKRLTLRGDAISASVGIPTILPAEYRQGVSPQLGTITRLSGIGGRASWRCPQMSGLRLLRHRAVCIGRTPTEQGDERE